MKSSVRAALAAALALLSACATTSTPRPALSPGAAVELVDTPFYPQDQYQCGPAALATVLVASRLEITPEALVSQVYVPERRGSLQAEMIAATRRQQRVPVMLAPTLDAVTAELDGGRPVLVLLNLGLRSIPAWHYAVVVGYDPARQTLVLRSGREPRAIMRISRFDAAWDRAGRWALTASAVDSIPATATTQTWIAAVAPFESIGQFGAAEAGYKAAAARWSGAALPRTALGNVYAAQRRWPEAVGAYSQAVRLQPAAALLNNRANALLELACPAEARRDLDAADAIAPSPAIATSLQRTRQRLDALVPSACPATVRAALAQ